MPARLALIHGAATRPSVYDAVVAAITSRAPEADVVVPARASSGDLATELDALGAAVEGRIVAGVSGGATLGLALLAAGAPVVAAVLHEPAAGSLAPGLLTAVAAAYQSGGDAAFGRALYGPAWQPGHGPHDSGAVGHDLAMFRAFEPAPAAAGWQGRVVLTVGELSPPVRHEVVALLAETFGYEMRVVPGCSHAAHLEAPEAFAEILLDVASS